MSGDLIIDVLAIGLSHAGSGALPAFATSGGLRPSFRLAPSTKSRSARPTRPPNTHVHREHRPSSSREAAATASKPRHLPPSGPTLSPQATGSSTLATVHQGEEAIGTEFVSGRANTSETPLLLRNVGTSAHRSFRLYYGARTVANTSRSYSKTSWRKRDRPVDRGVSLTKWEGVPGGDAELKGRFPVLHTRILSASG